MIIVLGLVSIAILTAIGAVAIWLAQRSRE
jgi:hypothetical protein